MNNLKQIAETITHLTICIGSYVLVVAMLLHAIKPIEAVASNSSSVVTQCTTDTDCQMQHPNEEF